MFRHDEVQWAAVLRSLSALQAYHRRRRGPVTGHPTVAFLLRDPDFPGSIAHCLAEVEDLAAGLPRAAAVDAAARSAMRTLVAVANAPLDRLHDGIDDVQEALAAVHDEVEATYFPHVPDEPATRGATTGSVRARRLGQSRSADAVDVCPGRHRVRVPGRSRPGGGPGRRASDGAWRPTGRWRRSSALGPDELARRQRAADRLMVADGAGVVLHEDAAETLRPWRIDVVPLVMDAATWADLAAGLAERAEVLAAVTADLFGPRLLLSEGIVPVEALAGHATYPALGVVRRAEAPRLTVAGADVVVDAGGAFRVVADATDVPGGDGHALLARSISARVLPRARPSLGLRRTTGPTPGRCGRCSPAAAPAGQASPRIVVVTGPPDEPGYVENSYLATQLGYDLAESGDVVVRGGRAWLRSLEGLEQIDVLLRRVPETALDPVEDDRVAGAGVAGVVEAVRDHGVAVVNPHGAGRGGLAGAAALPRRRRPVPDRPAPAAAERPQRCGAATPTAPGRRCWPPPTASPPRRRPAAPRAARRRRRAGRRRGGGVGGPHHRHAPSATWPRR